jgi:hypothetical protein
MATIYYIREGSGQGRINSSREVSVQDLLSLYGSSPADYEFLDGIDSPDIGPEQRPSVPGDNPAHVIAKIDNNEAGDDIFPKAGYYRVHGVNGR